jgi:hypothetical protein
MYFVHTLEVDMQELAEIEAQLVAIRAAVSRDGGATVGCEELRLLCPDHMSVPEQFQRIAEIAQREGWSFAFLADGGVRFGSYAAAA